LVGISILIVLLKTRKKSVEILAVWFFLVTVFLESIRRKINIICKVAPDKGVWGNYKKSY
jgi:hypothetical protein